MIDILFFFLVTMKLELKYPIATTNDCTYVMLYCHYDRSAWDQLHSRKTDAYLLGVPKTVRGPPITL